MKTLFFIVLIGGCGFYLLLNGSPSLSHWVQQQLPEAKAAQMIESLEQQVAHQVELQLVALRQQQQQQQAQSTQLQSELGQMAEKIHRLETRIVARQPVPESMAGSSAVVESNDVVEVIPLGAGQAEPTDWTAQAAVDSDVGSKAGETAAPLMEQGQRRKALQNLSRRMALKALDLNP